MRVPGTLYRICVSYDEKALSLRFLCLVLDMITTKHDHKLVRITAGSIFE